MVWSRLEGLVFGVLLSSALVACSPETVSTIVRVDLLFPEGESPLDDVATLRVRVVPEDGGDALEQVIERPGSGSWQGLDRGLELGKVSLDSARVVIEGASSAGVVVAAGESIPVPIRNGTEGHVAVFVQAPGSSGAAPPLEQSLTQHAAAYLEGGGVILAGGPEGSPSAAVWVYAVDLYEPIELAALPSSRSLPALASLGGSEALLLGGSQPSEVSLTYSPTSDAWTARDLPAPFQGSWPRPLVAELPDGGAIAVRGRSVLRVAQEGTSALLGELPEELTGATLSICGGDRAVLVGEGDAPALAFDTTDAGALPIAPPPAGPRTGHGAATLSDGRLVLAGGGPTDGPLLEDVEVYDPAEDAWVAVEGLLEGQARRGGRLVTLSDDRLVLCGGVDGEGRLMREAAVLDLEAERVELVPLVDPRREHTATALPTGAVLLLGGLDLDGAPLTSVEVLRPPR